MPRRDRADTSAGALTGARDHARVEGFASFLQPGRRQEYRPRFMVGAISRKSIHPDVGCARCGRADDSVVALAVPWDQIVGAWWWSRGGSNP
jgi:hypothetical protein